ncbi:MAG: phosphatase PAP2 family protein [Cyclobacteriaceae bacterium]
MLEWILDIDRELFLALNGLGSPYLDDIMIAISNKYVWIPLYLYLIFRLYQRFGVKFYWAVAVVLLVIVCTDQITANVFKPFFGRLRPCKDPSLEGFMTIIGHCRGFYGFASGHAANSMGLACIIYLIEKSTFGRAMIVWSLVVAYSRIYLGVHYPTDIIVGLMLGAILAYLIYFLVYKTIQARAYLA